MGLDFHWIDEKYTNSVIFSGREYKIGKEQMWGSYLIYIVEDQFEVASENTANDSFKEVFNEINADINSQIILWSCNKILNSRGVCDYCKEEKIVMGKNIYEIEANSFPEINQFCKQCRYQLYAIRSREDEKQRRKENLPYIKLLRKNPPVIIGGFSKKVDALHVLNSLDNEEVEDQEDGFVLAKGIVRFKDGTYYPVFLTISLSDSGELWTVDFIAENYEELISGEFAKPYLGKTKKQIEPFEYETLSYLDQDSHQDGWIKSARYLGLRSHLMNHISKPEFIDEEGPIKTRSYFSIQHILSAVYLARQSQIIEQMNKSEISEEDFVNHRSLIISSILSSASFLEAVINEFFSDTYDNRNGIVKDLEDDKVKLLSNMWKLNIPKTAQYSILNKYQIALSLIGNITFDTSTSPYQNIDLLVKLRNSLIHYEPEWVDIQTVQGEHKKIQKFEKFLSNKFDMNPFTGDKNPFFPDKCLGYGCARWAIISCIEFTDDFFYRVGLMPTYNHIRSRLLIDKL